MIDSSGLMQMGTIRQQTQQTDSQLQAMKQMGKQGISEAREEKLREACQDFQSIFIKQMLESMRKTVQETGLLSGGRAEKIFEDMLYDEYAKKMSKTAGFGLDEMIYRQLTGSAPGASGKSNPPTAPEAQAPNGAEPSSTGKKPPQPDTTRPQAVLGLGRG